MFGRWVLTPPTHLGAGMSPLRIHGLGMLRYTVDKRAARILLECFLVKYDINMATPHML